MCKPLCRGSMVSTGSAVSCRKAFAAWAFAAGTSNPMTTLWGAEDGGDEENESRNPTGDAPPGGLLPSRGLDPPDSELPSESEPQETREVRLLLDVGLFSGQRDMRASFERQGGTERPWGSTNSKK